MRDIFDGSGLHRENYRRSCWRERSPGTRRCRKSNFPQEDVDAILAIDALRLGKPRHIEDIQSPSLPDKASAVDAETSCSALADFTARKLARRTVGGVHMHTHTHTHRAPETDWRGKHAADDREVATLCTTRMFPRNPAI